MKRTVARIKAMMLLVMTDIRKDIYSIDELNNILSVDNELTEFESNDIFCIKIYKGVLKNIKIIDNIINISMENWTLDRLSSVDRALIRIATYEMKYTNTDKSIIINEILNITKEYSNIDDKQTKFNNGVLDKIGRFIYE